MSGSKPRFSTRWTDPDCSQRQGLCSGFFLVTICAYSCYLEEAEEESFAPPRRNKEVWSAYCSLLGPDIWGHSRRDHEGAGARSCLNENDQNLPLTSLSQFLPPPRMKLIISLVKFLGKLASLMTIDCFSRREVHGIVWHRGTRRYCTAVDVLLSPIQPRHHMYLSNCSN